MKNANLPSEKRSLARAMLTVLTYDNMKLRLNLMMCSMGKTEIEIVLVELQQLEVEEDLIVLALDGIIMEILLKVLQILQIRRVIHRNVQFVSQYFTGLQIVLTKANAQKMLIFNCLQFSCLPLPVKNLIEHY